MYIYIYIKVIINNDQSQHQQCKKSAQYCSIANYTYKGIK